ncbi:hypothetical protein HDU78_011681, partial [Chytriomyces hyalinus]
MFDALGAQFNLSTASTSMALLKRLLESKYRPGDDMSKHLALMIDTANTIKAGNAFTVDKLLIVSILMSLPDSGDWQTTVESLKTLNDKDLTLEKIKRRLLERATEVSKDRSRKPNSDKATAFH